jgi:DNA repair exonuclease SbcCD ATPase subunit
MWTGSETLATIDQSLRTLRGQLREVDQQVQTASKQLVELRQTTAQRYRDLAQVRLDRLMSGEIAAALDDADRRVAALLEARDQELSELERSLADNQRHQDELEAQRESQRRQVDEALQALDAAQAKTQQRLEADHAYREQLETARQADAVAREAEAKTEQAEADRAAKGAPYEADPLFMYLWRRGYGTSTYRATPHIRFLDGWVARLCGYHKARPNYWMLLEIPVRLRDHARRLREHAASLLEPVKQQEQQAAEANGVPKLAAALQSAQQTLADLDARIKELEETYRQLAQERAAYATGKDKNLRECLEALADQLERDPLRALRRHAEATPSPKDDVIVEELSDLDAQKVQLNEALQRYQQVYDRHLDRVKELEEVRRKFKANDYDDYGSVFANDALILAMLNEFLRGMAGAGDLWGTVRGNHRRRRTQSSPTFGSGGIGIPRGGWSAPRAPSAGSRGGIAGGGFRTTGGF